MMDSHSIVPNSLALSIHISGKILESAHIIICGVALHWHSCTHGLPLKIELGHDGLFRCELYLMMHTDIVRG